MPKPRTASATDGQLTAASALGRTIMHPEVLSVIDDYKRLTTEGARLAFADHFLSRTAGVMDEIWPVFYELLKCVEVDELYLKPGYLGEGQAFSSFEDYFEHRVKRPFETWAKMEKTYHYAQKYAPGLFRANLSDATATAERAKALGDVATVARQQAVEAADEISLPERGRPQKSINNRLNAGSTSSESYLRRRLKQDAPDLYRAVSEGTMTAHSAAIRAGMRHRNISIRTDDPDSAARTIRKHMPDAIPRLIELLTSEGGAGGRPH